MKKYLIIALAALLALPLSAQTKEKNNLTLTKISMPELGDVYSLGDTLFADANDIDRYSQFILYTKGDMKFRQGALYKNQFDGQLIEDFATFPGDFNDWVEQNIVYPKKAKKKGIQGEVSIACIIDTTGHVTHAQPVNQSNELLVKEAMRLISIMPAWKPAHFNERKGFVSRILNFEFTLPKEEK